MTNHTLKDTIVSSNLTELESRDPALYYYLCVDGPLSGTTLVYESPFKGTLKFSAAKCTLGFYGIGYLIAAFTAYPIPNKLFWREAN